MTPRSRRSNFVEGKTTKWFLHFLLPIMAGLTLALRIPIQERFPLKFSFDPSTIQSLKAVVADQKDESARVFLSIKDAGRPSVVPRDNREAQREERTSRGQNKRASPNFSRRVR
jgi:hypothetical protein